MTPAEAQWLPNAWRHEARRYITEVKDLLEELPVYKERDITDLIRRATLLLTPGADEKGQP